MVDKSTLQENEDILDKIRELCIKCEVDFIDPTEDKV